MISSLQLNTQTTERKRESETARYNDSLTSYVFIDSFDHLKKSRKAKETNIAPLGGNPVQLQLLGAVDASMIAISNL